MLHSGHVPHTPLVQQAVAPPQRPQQSVPPHPSGHLPQFLPRLAQVAETHRHSLFTHASPAGQSSMSQHSRHTPPQQNRPGPHWTSAQHTSSGETAGSRDR
jgi:hypothetical protein